MNSLFPLGFQTLLGRSEMHGLAVDRIIYYIKLSSVPGFPQILLQSDFYSKSTKEKYGIFMKA